MLSLFQKLATAAKASRYETSVCPVAGMLRGLAPDELDALNGLVQEARGHHEPLRQQGSLAPPRAAVRLLAGFETRDMGSPMFGATRVLRARLRAADAEAFDLLETALAAERARRGS